MGKTKNASIPQKDIYRRMNFLYQAAHTVLVVSPQDWDLSRHYTSTLKTLARKNVLRLHPNLKRSLCKKCDIILIAGLTAKVRVKSEREEHVVVTCIHCGFARRFLTRKDYVLWHERPENIKEIVVLDRKCSRSSAPAQNESRPAKAKN